MSTGYVYLLDRGDGVFKVGRTVGHASMRVDYATKKFGQGRSFTMVHRIMSDDPQALEAAFHRGLRPYKVGGPTGRLREFFALPDPIVAAFKGAARIDRAAITGCVDRITAGEAVPLENATTGREAAARSTVLVTFHISEDIADKVRDAVYHLTPRLTMTSLAENALRVELERLRRENGGPFPRRQENLKGGRPVKL